MCTEKKPRSHHVKVRNKRKYARRKLNEILARQRSKCNRCGCQIVNIQLIKAQDRIKLTCEFLTYLNSDGRHIKAKIATVEHIKPISEDGTNSEDNLEALCYRCNAKLNTINQREKSRGVCRKCGYLPRARYGRYCEKCRQLNTLKWLEMKEKINNGQT